MTAAAPPAAPPDTPPPPARPRVDVAGARAFWRWLTSMRTALLLLLLLAVAAVPGSLLPQRSINAADVARYAARNPDAAVWLDRLWLFDV
jgi:cytochrome c biogenesis protein